MTIAGDAPEPGAGGAVDMEVEAFKRLYPLQFFERYLNSNVRPDGRPLMRARPTSINLGAIPTADGSALVKIGNTTMLAGVKLEVMVPSSETPDQGQIAVDFQMPAICSPLVRPGRPAEAACVVSEQLSNILMSSNFVTLQELCIAPGKAAWIAYLDIYCLDADGSLVDAALLAAVAALAHLQLPAVTMSEGGRVIPLNDKNGGTQQDKDDMKENDEDRIVKSKQRLQFRPAPIALTCMKHKKHLLADPSAEEESLLQSSITVATDSSERLISFFKPGGSVSATSATIQDCITLAKRRSKEVQEILDDALAEVYGDTSGMQVE